MLALSLIAYLAMNLVRIMQLSRVGKFAHRFSVCVGMGCPPYLAVARSQLMGAPLNRESKERNCVERARLKVLDPKGEKFPFQCSCGVKHQFSYRESEGERLLEVMLFHSKTR